METAILVDFDFYLRRRRKHLGSLLSDGEHLPKDDPERVSTDLWNHCIAHIRQDQQGARLYRILVYDCPTHDRKVFNPVARQQFDLSRTDQFAFRTAVHQSLVKKRSVALRLGSLAYKRLVRRIVLISGDADFVPAAKLARREGIDVVFDPMGHHIGDGLAEHVDGVATMLQRLKL
jgi:uncharacterized LabA/DUF88 family protein